MEDQEFNSMLGRVKSLTYEIGQFLSYHLYMDLKFKDPLSLIVIEDL